MIKIFNKLDSEKPLVSRNYLLEKYPGKGGWTYAAIPEILPDKKSPFGWVKVRGWIDDFEIKNYKLMPMGNGKLFLPLKAEIRKKIDKQEGNWVLITLYPETDSIEIPEEFLVCLETDPMAFEIFLSYTDGQKKQFIDWIYSAKTESTKIERIAKTLNKLVKQMKHKDDLNHSPL
jgi:hypothetical protein